MPEFRKKPTCQVSLLGDGGGSSFWILVGFVSATLKRAGLLDRACEFRRRAFKLPQVVDEYNISDNVELLALVVEYVEVC